MQFSISINQKAFRKLAPDCDIIDAAIFDFIYNYIASGKTERITDNGDWYWISYQKVIDENPILGIKSKKPIYRRVQKLIDAEILVRYEGNKEKQKTYLGRGKNFELMVYTSDFSTLPPRTQKSYPPRTQKSYNHNTNKDHSTNDHSNAQFEEFWELYDKKKGKQKALQKWKKLDPSEIPKILENIPIFKTHFSDKQYLPYPRKYLHNKYWQDEDFQKPKQNKNGYNQSSIRPTRGDRQAEQLRVFLSAN